MKLIDIHVEGYIRMATNSFKSIRITPQSDFIVILGSNGSGKSSLMDLISPLPPSKSLFESNGSLYRKYEHKGKIYTLSVVGPVWKHEFYIDDGENLNPGGTATVQNELIRQEFGIDKEIMDLLTNRTKFTTMAPSIGRRQWIAKLNTTNLDYAMECFRHYAKRFKEARDVSRYLDNRITSETAKQLDGEDTRRMEEEVEFIKQEIEYLIGNELQGNGGDEIFYSNTLEDARNKLVSSSKNIIKSVKLIKQFKQHSIVNAINNHSLNNIENQITELKKQLATEEGLFNHFRREFSDLDNLSDFMHGDVHDIGELEDKLRQLETEMDLARRSIQLFHLDGDMDGIIQDSEALSALNDVLQDLPSNEDRSISPEKLRIASQELSEYRYQIDALENRVANIRKRIETIKHAKESRCPKCSYVWVDGVSEDELEQCYSLIKDLETKKSEIEQKIPQLDELVQSMSNYISSIRQYKNYTVSYPRLQPLWDVISERGYLFNEPNRIQYVVKNWMNDIRVCKLLHALGQEVKILKETLNFSQRLGEQGGWELAERKQMLQNSMESAMGKIDVLHDDLLVMEDLLKQMRLLRDLVEEKNHAIKTIKENLPKYTEAIRGNMLKEVVHQHYQRLNELQVLLNEKTTLEKIIDDLVKSQRSVNFDREVFGCISSVLSPSDGLIAESLMGSVHTLVDTMNPIIGEIWNKPLTIRPCQNKNGELDYIFPIAVGNVSNGTEHSVDSSGSSSEEDIINLAFKLAICYILDLNDFPLIIDELGRSFDDLHRVNLMNYIKQLADRKFFSQIFMINHYQAQYGSFNNAEVVVINDSNIVVPTAYNQNVIFG